MAKKLISFLLTATMMTSIIPSVATAEEYSVKTLLYSDDFESYNVGDEPLMDIYESAGDIAIAKVGTTKALHIKNVNINSNATAEKAIERIEKKPVTASVRFMQKQTVKPKFKSW